jgi:hypothetical protein
MKKLIGSVAILALLIAISSCGNGRHNCPAYGSIDANSTDVEITVEK